MITRTTTLFAALLGLGASLVALALDGCVGDEPNTTSNADEDAATDVSPLSDASADTSASDSAATDAATPLLPSQIQGSSLQLWLKADKDVTCASGRATTWLDQSTQHRDAVVANSAVGPRCSVAMHTLNGIAVPYFDAFNTTPNSTLKVDLSFALNSSYSIFVVHRRWQNGPSDASLPSSCILGSLTDGTTCPASFGHGTSLCYQAFNGPELWFDQDCSEAKQTITPIDGGVPATAEVDEMVLTKGTSQMMYVNGVGYSAGAKNLDGAAPVFIGDAYLGLAYYIQTTDTRYNGDIAEVIGYDIALDATDRAAVESYLKSHWGLTF